MLIRNSLWLYLRLLFLVELIKLIITRNILCLV
nr:MAG TPA: hypothetical protein [Bacteriophage sp.]